MAPGGSFPLHFLPTRSRDNKSHVSQVQFVLATEKRSRLILLNSTRSQQALWARLDALDKKRQNIEGLILNSMKSIESHSTNLSGELATVFEGRIEELDDSGFQDE